MEDPVPNKPYFVTLNRDFRARKSVVFQLQLFPWRRSAKHLVERLDSPMVTYFLELALMGSQATRYQPFRLWVSKEEEPTPHLPDNLLTSRAVKFFDADLVVKILDRAKEVLVDEAAGEEEERMVEAVLQKTRVVSERVNKAKFCRYCFQRHGRFRALPKGHAFEGYGGVPICRWCAGRELLDQVKAVVGVSKKLKNLLRDLLLKFKSVEKVAEMFSPKFDPVANADLTLYDEVPGSPAGAKVERVRVDDLAVPEAYRNLLHRRGIEELTPVQVLAVRAGAFEGRDLLVVSATSSGKTLVGELCAVPRLLEAAAARKGSKRPRNRFTYLYLAPLVALANQRYEEYRKEYRSLGLRVALRVGVSRVGGRVPSRGSGPADVVVGTYEAVDYLVRRRRRELLGVPLVIVVDEIQMLGDPERGYLLDGLLARLRALYPQAQFVFLSATIAKPKKLARELKARLVFYEGRPVPLERHLVVCTSPHEKVRVAAALALEEFKRRSSAGFRGQTILFTHSRRRCHELASALASQGVKAVAYHAGLTSVERSRVEALFNAQKVACVVTTAALGAGVDLPASQVIFESLTMGANWLTVAEFEQMSGRAGRLGKHSRGKVVLLAEPDRTYNPGQTETEERVALSLLGGVMNPLELVPDEGKAARELLAYLASRGTATTEELYMFRGKLLNSAFKVPKLASRFQLEGLAAPEAGPPGEKSLRITPLGDAFSSSFMDLDDCSRLLGEVCEVEEGDVEALQRLVVDVVPLKNVYLTSHVVRELSKQTRRGGASSMFFTQASRAFMDANSVVLKRKRLKGPLLALYLRWVQDLFTCDCEQKPECGCARVELELKVVKARASGRSLENLRRKLRDDYEILVYYGDLLNYLDSLVHVARSVARMAEVKGKDWAAAQLRKLARLLESP
ncbi:MAG: DUF5814 domain-containing protein [Promethearchaeota archaeon]